MNMQQSHPVPTSEAAAPFIITETWLKRHATKGCAWNKVQLAALGLGYPQPKGWLHKIVGTRITQEQRQAFEASQKKPAYARPASPMGSHMAQPTGCAEAVAHLRSYVHAFAALARCDQRTSEFLNWLGHVAERLAPGAATREDVIAMANEGASFVRDILPVGPVDVAKEGL